MMSLLEKHEKVLMIGLFIVFCAITIPGIAWGAPDLWHPDEVVRQTMEVLDGDLRFDETDFNHPSLPKYVMYGLGWVIYKFGHDQFVFLVGSRLLSVLLGACVVVLVYRLTRLLGGRVSSGLIAALVIMTNHHFAAHSRWAHNDLYVTFFTALAVFAAIKYTLHQQKLWLYLSFLAVGWAASSKYIGGVLFLALVLVYAFDNLGKIRKEWLAFSETLFIGGVLSGLGFAMGTPKSALWFAFYVKRLLPALRHLSTFGKAPGSVPGILGQWEHLRVFLGIPLFGLSILALGWVIFELAKSKIRPKPWDDQQRGLAVLVAAILVLDLPILVSYNLQERFFLPLFPALAALLALTFERLLTLLREKAARRVITAFSVGLGVILVFNALRVVAVGLLFLNDSRMAASESIRNLEPKTSIEYTFYQPTIPEEDFSSAHNYPLAFIQYPDQPIPTSPHYSFNAGEAGVEARKPEYLVIDSFTAQRFEAENTCNLLPVDCDFFARLQAGQTNYELIWAYHYQLPGFLPDPGIIFLNPGQEIYQRTK